MAQKSGADLIREAKERITEVAPSTVKEMVDGGEKVVLVDVREHNEWNLGHIPGAIHVPLGELPAEIGKLVPKDARVVAYCARGNRSALAADSMQDMGYTDVRSMSDGWFGWVQAGGGVED